MVGLTFSNDRIRCDGSCGLKTESSSIICTLLMLVIFSSDNFYSFHYNPAKRFSISSSSAP